MKLSEYAANIDYESKNENGIAPKIDEKDCQNYLLTLYESHVFDKAESDLISPAWPDDIKLTEI